ncbi:uncharacterized protein LOC121430959 isoform X2 [Lytechinus variegatus]|uniref:uncharacterized protein LOC121409280 isoform X2 n=1 Tax=Lytechinus variegatus TaxID=7654 RepID=UPI001BB15477|nr:uncharacterized protein LOC121409280 isoform X2 [Lytechinus variegatus]XP_041484333.1 uncharacterized protein LOC121430959 isoform X2 [Lytechinus variegatus]
MLMTSRCVRHEQHSVNLHTTTIEFIIMSKRDKGGEDPGGSGDVPTKKIKHVGGNRCVLYGCSNTMYNGFAIHEMPKQGSIRRAWINFIQLRLKGFHANERARVHVCSGHFQREQYDQSQVMQYQYGYRKLPPRLLPNAVPRLHQAVQPFPAEWFIKESIPPAEPTPTTSTLTVASCRSSDTSTVHSSSTNMTVAFLRSEKSNTSTRKENEIKDPRPVTLADASTCMSPTLPSSGGSKRRTSLFSRKKEVCRIAEEYARKEEEEAAREAAAQQARREQENTKAVQVQLFPDMVDKQFQKKPKTRTCAVQVKPAKPPKPIKPVTKEKGIQVCLSSGKVVPTVTSSTQTDHLEAESEDNKYDDKDDECDDEDVEYDNKDPDYIPEQELEEKDAEEFEKVNMPADIISQQKYIVFEEQLIELFRQCRSCHLPCSVEIQQPANFGSRIKVVSTCEECGSRHEWSSQPTVGNLSAGNILLSSAILFAGASATKIFKIFKIMNLRGISTSTFNEHQTKYLQPAVILEWRKAQSAILTNIKASEHDLIVGGDGRSDSPGHSAKFGSYTLMDLRTDKVIDVQLVQCTEVKNSNAMELEGLKRALEKMDAEAVEIKTIVTDRHLQIAKFLRENYPHIDHRYDVWHIAKGLKKKLKALGRVKDCELVQAWLRTLINHVYWTALSSPGGDKDVMKSKYKRSMNHIRNIHTDQDPEQACEHGDDYPAREWMKSGTKVYEKLREIMLNTRILNDIGKMSPHAQTSKVEAFHNVLLHWCPKLLVYSYQGMKCRLYLAALHWNENCGRSQAQDVDGNPVYKLKYPRSKEGGHTVEKVLTACTYDYVKALLRVVLDLVENKLQIRGEMDELQPKPARSASYQKPNKSEAVQAFEEHHRFADRT